MLELMTMIGEARHSHWLMTSNLGVDPRRLVFIDETWAKTNMTSTYGRCARGERLIAKVTGLTLRGRRNHGRLTLPPTDGGCGRRASRHRSTTTSPTGREQQMSRLPVAGKSSG
jgi:hypothetical protein